MNPEGTLRRVQWGQTDAFTRSADRLLAKLTSELSGKTVENYSYALERGHRVLLGNGPTPALADLRKKHLDTIRESFKSLDPHLSMGLNSVLSRVGIKNAVPYKLSPRRNVRWLSEDQATRLLKAAYGLGPPWLTLVHLELQNGFRRVSVMRAHVRDLETTQTI